MKSLRCLIKFLFAVVLLFLILGFSFFIFLATEKGQKWAFHAAIEMLEQVTETNIYVENYQISFPSSLHLHHIVLTKQSEKVIEIGDLVLEANPYSLSRGLIVIEQLLASDIHIFNPLFSLPSPNNSFVSTTSPPLIPIDFIFHHIHLKEVFVEDNIHFSSIVGEASFNSEGEVDMAVFESKTDSLIHLSKNLKDIEGSLLLEASFCGPIENLQWDIKAASDHLAFNEHSITNLLVSLRSTPTLKEINNFSVSLNFEEIAFKATSSLIFKSAHELALLNTRIDFLGTTAEGNLLFFPNNLLVEGELMGATKDLSRFWDGSVQGQGEIQMQFVLKKLETETPTQQIHTIFVGKDLRWKKERAEQMVLYTKFDRAEEEVGQVQFAIRGFDAPLFHIDELLGSTFIAHSMSQIPIHLQGHGNLVEKIKFTAEGNWSLQEKSATVELEQLIGTLGPYPLKLQNPFKTIFSNHQITVEEAKATWGSTQITASASLVDTWHILLKAQGSVEPYVSLFLYDKIFLNGDFQVDASLTETADSFRVKGFANLTNGTFESFSTGTLYKGIQAHLEGNEEILTLTSLSALDNKGGHIIGHGAIALKPLEHYPFAFDITPSHIFIVDSDYLKISASGRLKLSGSTAGSALKGELAIEEANLDLEQTPPSDIKHIDITVINNPLAEEAPVTQRKEEFPLELDIKLRSAKNLFITGKHVTSEWKGSLQATGSIDHIQISGDLKLIDGSYDFNGKPFVFNTGNIHFAGSVPKKTTLYLVASKEIDRITAEIVIKGAVSNPLVSFRSNPPLPQREVLSYILFDRGLSDITTSQGEQLSQSFVSLNANEAGQSSGGSENFLSRLRNNIGIDRLDFTAKSQDGDNQDFGLQLGKHITENIMISVNQGVTSLSPIIAVEAKLRKNIKFQAETGVGADAPITMSIKWKKDY